MAEYISRETMINLLQSMADNAEANGFSYDREVIEAVRVTLAGIPAADVAQVVRCKDCIFKGFPDEYDTYFCERTNEEIQLSDFCSHAVREEQNND